MRLIAAVFFFIAAPGMAAEGPWLSSFQAAQRAASASGKPILLEFGAVWCYSCYYMEQRVLGRERFQQAARGLVLLKLDVDQAEGLALKKKYRASFLPTFLLLGGDGAELGRIVGELTEEEFLAQLARLTGSARDSAIEGLRSALDAKDLAKAEALRRKLDQERPDLAGREDWRLLSARIDLRRAISKDGAGEAAAALKRVLELEKDCALAYDVFAAGELVAKSGKERAEASWGEQRRALERLAERRVFGKEEERCADTRSVVEAAAGVYERLGLAQERKAILGRAIALLQDAVAKAGVGDDRNRDDNLRHFLEQGGRDRELEELYGKLHEAYPADYVYAHRYAKHLHAKGRDAEALDWVEKAYRLSYGANRLKVSRLRAEILEKLGRREEAAALLGREIKANASRFPEETAALKGLLAK